MPRPPGATYVLCRRAVRRELKFLPKGLVRDAFGFALAAAAEKFGILIHAVMIVSNHYHAVVTDVHGNISDFLAELHRDVTCTLNAGYKRSGTMWENEKTSCVRLLDGETIVEKIVYTLANPVAAGLVESHKEWPGLNSCPGSYTGGPRKFKRPECYFDAKGAKPEEAVLRIVVPPQFAALGEAGFADLIRRRLAAREQSLRDEMKAKGKTFMGRRKVLAQTIDMRPTSPDNRGKLNPTIAGADPEMRKAELHAYADWLKAYRAALEAWPKDHAVLFPYGTNKMVRRYGACCAPAPGSDPPA